MIFSSLSAFVTFPPYRALTYLLSLPCHPSTFPFLGGGGSAPAAAAGGAPAAAAPAAKAAPVEEEVDALDGKRKS